MSGDARDDFYALSSALTGFSRLDLEGTGVGDAYLEEMRSNVGRETLAALLGTWAGIGRDHPGGDCDAAIQARIFGSDALRPAAQRLVMLWYVGSWYFVRPFTTRVVSSQSYIEGLMWKAIGSHPMAAKPQGYGAWALPPPPAS
jgi:hypothetical protein